MPEAYIIDAVRTPRAIGKVGKGALAGLHPQVLAATVLKALKDRNDLNTAEVDDIIWGTSAQMGLQGGDMGRMAALDAGYDVRASGVTLDRFCGSGVTAVNLAAAQILSGMEDLLVAGGTEMMSFVNAYGQSLREAGVKSPGGIGTGNARLQKKHPQSNQGVCADAIASMEGIGREALDAIGLMSQQRAGRAIAGGYFAKSTVAVVGDDGKVILDREEYPRPNTTMTDLAQLKPAFAQIADMPSHVEGETFRQLINRRYPELKIVPLHHAGTSSGVVDGAAALLLASPDYARRHGMKARARVVATANVGDDPTLMLNGPVPATLKVLKRANLALKDIDLFEVNEAFAVVIEKYVRDLKIDRERINVNGGAIALGHPIGATGAVLIGTVLDELERRELKRALVTMCAAGGMAPAIIIERL